MAQRIVVGSTVTFTPSEGEATDYIYNVSDSETASVSAEGVLTALSPGQLAVMIVRYSDNVVVKRAMYQVVTQEELDAVGTLPTFSLEVVPPVTTRVTNVDFQKVFNADFSEDSHGFNISWSYVPIGDGSDDWATELEFQVEMRQGFTLDDPLLTAPALTVLLPRSQDNTYSVSLGGVVPLGLCRAFVGLVSRQNLATSQLEIVNEALVQSGTVTDVVIANSLSTTGVISPVVSAGDLYNEVLSNNFPSWNRVRSNGTILFSGGTYQGNANYTGWKAFDGTTATMSNSDYYAAEHSIGYITPLRHIATSLSVKSVAAGAGEIVANNWQYTTRFFKLQGSNDSTAGTDGTWTDIQSFSLSPWTGPNETKTVSVTNSTAYSAYKVITTDGGQICFAEVVLTGH